MSLFTVFLRAKSFLLKEEIYIIFHFYKNIRFFLVDSILKIASFFINPYRAHRKFQERRGDRAIYSYGETPLSEFAKVMQKIPFSSSDQFVDIGAGRGRLSLWIASFYPMHVTAIEHYRGFTSILKILQKVFFPKKLSIVEGNFFTLDYSPYTIIYLYASTLSEIEIHALSRKLSKAKKGSYLFSVSYPINDGHWQLLESFLVNFPWGKGMIYIQKKQD